jgi:hypothetical protein
LRSFERTMSLNSANKTLIRTQTTLRFVCAAQLERYFRFLKH